MVRDNGKRISREIQQIPAVDQMDIDDSGADHQQSDEQADEMEVLQRLSNNYRRFSQHRRLNDPTDDEEDTQDVNMHEQSVNDDYLFDEEEDDEEEDEDGGEDSTQHNDDEDEHIEQLEAMEMLASALFGGRGRPHQDNDQPDTGNPLERMMMNSFFQQLSPGMSNSRINDLINALKTQEDPYLTLETLNEISTSLLMMNSMVSERSVSTYNTAKTLIDILNRFPEDMQIQLVACRCLYNLAEANFYSMTEIVSAGAIEKLNSMMLDMSYMDLAEQALQTLEIISRKCGQSLMSRHSIPAVIMYLDFFTIHAQRKALKIVASASSFIRSTSINDARNAFPIIQNVALSYSDPECVESAWIFICNTLTWTGNTKDDLESLTNNNLLKSMSSVVLSRFHHKSDQSAPTSSSLINSKTQLRVSNSLFLLSTNIPQISLKLLKDCDLGGSFSKTLKDNTAHSTIDSILSFPKNSLFSYLKLVASCLPKTSSNISDIEDPGQYFGNTSNDLLRELQTEKNQLFKTEDQVNNFYSNFAMDFFPILLEIFSSSVDFKQRRLILIMIIRMLTFFDGSVLDTIVLNSKLIDTIAPSVIKGQAVLSNSTFSSIPIKLKCIIYGCLLISHILISKNNPLFLDKFTREGLIEHFQSLNLTLNNISKYDLSNISNLVANEEISEADDFYDEDIDQDGEELEVELEEEEEEEDVAEEERDGVPENSPLIASHVQYISHKVEDFPIVHDGIFPLSQESWLTGLLNISNEIESDYRLYSSSSNQIKPNYILLLDDVNKFFDQLLLNPLDDSITNIQFNEMWRLLASSLSVRDGEKEISSYEFVSSGIILKLATILEKFPVARDTFAPIFCLFEKAHDDSLPFIKLINLLNESMNRSESFDILTSDLTSTEANTRSNAQIIKKQMKLRIIIDNNCDNKEVESYIDDESNNRQKLIVMVQAIATFGSLDSFIKRNSIRFTSMRDTQDDSNYHYEFFLNDELVPLDTTVFGAGYKLLKDEHGENVPISSIFNAPMLTIIAKKRRGEREVFDLPISYFNDNHVPNFTDETTMSVLNLMNVLHSINENTTKSDVNNSLFLNYKLTAKLKRQLEEPLIVASGILPEWAMALPRHYSFIFPLDARIFFMKSTSFGYSRLMNLWANKSKEEEGSNGTASLGRSVRHKLRIARNTMFLGAMKIMQNFASKPGFIEIEYYEEAGSGLGPTLEFYANVSREFSKTKLFMWRSDSYGTLKLTSPSVEEMCDSCDEYIHEVNGLFPRPLNNLPEKSLAKIKELFKFLGRFLARSFLDSRIVDFRFNSIFFKMAIDLSLNKPGMRTLSLKEKLNVVKKVDPMLSKSLTQLIEFSKESDSDNKISSLSLSYILPGYPDYDLKPNGNSIDIDKSNLGDYIHDVINATLFDGVEMQVRAFVNGFNDVFPFNSLMLFTPDEFLRLSGNEKEDWSVATLLSTIHADHGYTTDSLQIQWLVTIMSSFGDERRRKFLQFLTGSPRLPIGGFKSLTPSLTVVLKHAENGLTSDEYLPSVMTCANYLKLPQYSSIEIMEFKLVHAMDEGANAFLLS